MGRMIFAKPVNQKGQQTNKKTNTTWHHMTKVRKELDKFFLILHWRCFEDGAFGRSRFLFGGADSVRSCALWKGWHIWPAIKPFLEDVFCWCQTASLRGVLAVCLFSFVLLGFYRIDVLNYSSWWPPPSCIFPWAAYSQIRYETCLQKRNGINQGAKSQISQPISTVWYP